MFETGQPVHAFDYDAIAGRHIIVRRGEDGETFNALDGIEHTLTRDVLVIADESGAVGLAGVIGGLESEVTPATKNILLESANFLGANIRRTGSALKVRTEASTRFEKGLPPEFAMIASKRATKLFVEIAGGTRARRRHRRLPGQAARAAHRGDEGAHRARARHRSAHVEGAQRDVVARLHRTLGAARPLRRPRALLAPRRPHRRRRRRRGRPHHRLRRDPDAAHRRFGAVARRAAAARVARARPHAPRRSGHAGSHHLLAHDDGGARARHAEGRPGDLPAVSRREPHQRRPRVPANDAAREPARDGRVEPALPEGRDGDLRGRARLPAPRRAHARRRTPLRRGGAARRTRAHRRRAHRPPPRSMGPPRRRIRRLLRRQGVR